MSPFRFKSSRCHQTTLSEFQYLQESRACTARAQENYLTNIKMSWSLRLYLIKFVEITDFIRNNGERKHISQ
jgi:hypothetical protein